MEDEVANMKRWTDLKLEKELAFAQAAQDVNDPATLAWLRSIIDEIARRHTQTEAVS